MSSLESTNFGVCGGENASHPETSQMDLVPAFPAQLVVQLGAMGAYHMASLAVQD